MFLEPLIDDSGSMVLTHFPVGNSHLIRTHTHIHIYIYTHTHTHTHTQWGGGIIWSPSSWFWTFLYVCSLTRKWSVYNFNGRFIYVYLFHNDINPLFKFLLSNERLDFVNFINKRSTELTRLTQINFHCLICSYLPRVPSLAMTVCVCFCFCFLKGQCTSINIFLFTLKM